MIKYDDFLKIVGLLTLAREANKKLQDIGTALQNITGDKEEFGHCMDAVYGDYSAKELLDKLNLTEVDK